MIKLPDSWKFDDELDLPDHKCRRYSEFINERNEYFDEAYIDKNYIDNDENYKDVDNEF